MKRSTLNYDRATRTYTVFPVVDPAGVEINFSACGDTLEAATKWAAQTYGPDVTVSERTFESPVAACEKVLIEAGIPESRWGEFYLAMTRMLNMAHDAGRPSDAMRSVVDHYRLMGRAA